jgi:hypothetical protein
MALSYYSCKFSTKFSTQGALVLHLLLIVVITAVSQLYPTNYTKFSKRQEQLCFESGFSQSEVPYNSTGAQHKGSSPFLSKELLPELVLLTAPYIR